MSNQDLKNQTIEWLQKQPYWMQYLGNFLLENGEMNDEVTAKVYRLFKEEVGLEPQGRNPDVNFNKMVADDADASQQLTLQAIKDIANVNALAPGQEIKIGPRLTLIYGNNGTGKSGYVRLLNNAFSSRGDKKILPNVFKGATGEPECKFTFLRTEEPYDLSFPADRQSYEFAQFCVFDTKSVREHLEKENELSFTPSGFDFFDKLSAAQQLVREKLDAEIEARSKMHDLGPMFVRLNDVGVFVAQLGAETDLSLLEAFCAITDEETAGCEDLKARLETLKASDKSERVDTLANEYNQLSDFAERAKKALATLGKEALAEYKTSVETAVKFEELAKAEGIESFEDHGIAELGSDAWRSFIKAGRDYAEAVEGAHGGRAYPSEDDKCLLCLQPLSDKETKLYRAYWDLLKSNAQSELQKATLAIGDAQLKLASVYDLKFDESTTAFKTLKQFDPVLAQKWEGLINLFDENLAATAEAISERKTSKLPSPLEFSITDFDACLAKLESDRTALIDSNPDQEKSAIHNQIELFEDRVLLAKVKAKADAYVTAAKWAAKARLSTPVTLAKITKISGALYDRHVTDEYLAVFNEECEKLDAPKFVKISQRNSKGSTLRSLKIEGTSASSILSEGEQRAIAIADFITEARLDPYNRGLFFDDPVSSQDHDRRESIAERLVEIAKSRQVIIFTHDIAFFLRLLSLAKDEQVEVEQNYMQSSGRAHGMIYAKLPWIAQNLKTRIGTLKNDLELLKKTEKSGDIDAYERELKGWYGRLRDTWERAVEERLLKGVIERFGPTIQTQKLKTLEVTPELLADIERGMTNSSKWLHDQAAGLNPKLPDIAKVTQDLADIEAFKEKCKGP